MTGDPVLILTRSDNQKKKILLLAMDLIKARAHWTIIIH